MPELAVPLELDFTSETYKSAYSRINAIVIEGEYEANSNYIQLADILTDNKEELHRLAKMENRHMKGFQACGQNLQITPDMEYAQEFFSSLHDNFQIAYAEGKVVTCLLIQSLIIEAFAIAAYNIYIPVADPFARKITEVNDTNAKVILPNGKTKIYNIMRLKKFFAPSPNENGATNDQNSELNFKFLILFIILCCPHIICKLPSIIITIEPTFVILYII